MQTITLSPDLVCAVADVFPRNHHKDTQHTKTGTSITLCVRCVFVVQSYELNNPRETDPCVPLRLCIRVVFPYGCSASHAIHAASSSASDLPYTPWKLAEPGARPREST